MKRILMTVIAASVTVFAAAQEATTSLVSYTGKNKLALVKNSIDVPAWHEKTFWPLYENYLAASGKIASQTHRLRKAIADINESTSNEDARVAAENFLSAETQSIATKREYYQKISTELNGNLSLQFLQSEVVMDMMEASTAYDESSIKNFRFHPKVTSTEQFRQAKRNMIAKALNLTKDNGYLFWNMYNQYEEDLDNLLGEEYSLISYYANEPTDFTPALSKRMGHDILAILEREIKLKEKYYQKLKGDMGPVMAAKFLAWEDYYSVVSKMYAWADAP
ncbi:MAG TPA: hypothetical protein VGD40_04340 [Chryseosolibacter sp.]